MPWLSVGHQAASPSLTALGTAQGAANSISLFVCCTRARPLPSATCCVWLQLQMAQLLLPQVQEFALWLSKIWH